MDLLLAAIAGAIALALLEHLLLPLFYRPIVHVGIEEMNNLADLSRKANGVIRNVVAAKAEFLVRHGREPRTLVLNPANDILLPFIVASTRSHGGVLMWAGMVVQYDHLIEMNDFVVL